MRRSLHHDNLNNAIKDTDGDHYGCTYRPLLMHMSAIMGSHEWAVMGLESKTISVQVLKLIITI